MLKRFIIFFSLFSLYIASESESIIVRISNGRIRGRIFQSVQNKTIYAFQEIPYAKPPVGTLRFQEPQAPDNWDDILDTRKNTKICYNTIVGKKEDDPRETEDCLYINVYTPMNPKEVKYPRNLLPVMVYIYGGRFIYGDGTTVDLQQFVDSGIVCVSFNYRSGALGLLTTEDNVIPANNLLKDQYMVLLWVQKNIHVFGGDSNKVTGVGHSSGAISLDYHILNKKAKGLFRNAVMLSTSTLMPLALANNGRKDAYRLAQHFDKNFSEKNTSKELLHFLLTIPASKLSRTMFWMEEPNHYIKYPMALYWKPVLENPAWPNAYISGPMFENFFHGRYNKVPILIGTTSEETLAFKDSYNMTSWGKNLDEMTMLFHNPHIRPERQKQLEAKLKAIYTNSSFSKDHSALIQYLSDYFFSISTILRAEMVSKDVDVYFYKFSYYGKISEIMCKHDVGIPGLGNAGHAEEIPYIIYYPGKASIKDEELYPLSDILTRKRFVKIISNFVKYSNPTPKLDPLLQNIQLPKISENGFVYLDINTNLTLVKDFPRKYSKWFPLLQEYFERPLTTI